MTNTSKKTANAVAKCLRKVLQVEANTASTFMAYQPKVPAELKKFRSAK